MQIEDIKEGVKVRQKKNPCTKGVITDYDEMFNHVSFRAGVDYGQLSSAFLEEWELDTAVPITAESLINAGFQEQTEAMNSGETVAYYLFPLPCAIKEFQKALIFHLDMKECDLIERRREDSRLTELIGIEAKKETMTELLDLIRALGGQIE